MLLKHGEPGPRGRYALYKHCEGQGIWYQLHNTPGSYVFKNNKKKQNAGCHLNLANVCNV